MELYHAIYRGDLAGVNEALRNGANLDTSAVESGESPLHAASRHGNLAIVKVLLDAGANTKIGDRYGRTALHDACAFYGNLEVVKELVQRGADIFAKTSNQGGTPFDLAVLHPRKNVVEYLLQHYREKIFESEGRRSLLTILKQGDFSPGTSVDALQIGKGQHRSTFVHFGILCGSKIRTAFVHETTTGIPRFTSLVANLLLSQ